MAMSRYTKKKFIFVACYNCERPLARVLKGTETMCPKCNTWTVAGDETRLNRKPMPLSS